MLQEQLKEEVMSMAKRIGAANFNLLVIDTENKVRAHGYPHMPLCTYCPCSHADVMSARALVTLGMSV